MKQIDIERAAISKGTKAIAKRLREIADEIEKSSEILSLSADFDLDGFSCEYQTLRSRVNLEVKTEPLL